MSFNRWFVGSQGDTVVIQNPQVKFTGAQAIEYAAWIVAVSEVISGGGKDAFEEKYKEITSS